MVAKKISDFTTAKQELIKDAIKLGFNVDYDFCSATIVKRTLKTNKIKGTGLLLYADGTAHGIWEGCTLDVVACTRSHRVMRKILGV